MSEPTRLVNVLGTCRSCGQPVVHGQTGWYFTAHKDTGAIWRHTPRCPTPPPPIGGDPNA